MILLLGDRSKRIVSEAADVIRRSGFAETESAASADLIVAPWLQSKIPADEIAKTTHGALVFHPSLLPIHRGRNAIKDAYAAGDRVTGATWFWANDAFDAGEICEQEPLIILEGESPRDFYDRAVVPSAIRLLRFALGDIKAGIIRRRPQNNGSL